MSGAVGCQKVTLRSSAIGEHQRFLPNFQASRNQSSHAKLFSKRKHSPAVDALWSFCHGFPAFRAIQVRTGTAATTASGIMHFDGAIDCAVRAIDLGHRALPRSVVTVVSLVTVYGTVQLFFSQWSARNAHLYKIAVPGLSHCQTHYWPSCHLLGFIG